MTFANAPQNRKGYKMKKEPKDKTAEKKPEDKKPKKLVIKNEKSERSLKVTFTPEERQEMSISMASKYGELEQAELDKSKVTAQHSSKIKEHKADIRSLATKVNDGFEFQPVKCETVTDYKKATVKTTRLDSMELIEDRELRDDEKQPTLYVAAGMK
ncbi:hypothetical protein LCGC14_1355240 [marine sediment metagenome]|uniref:Uncharacterized protein n=1 Tax=marine sediment metagenome TaxID=412755 RepID=A0A0F9MQ62_9ZZZZ|nr:hypothetical protein [Candidatus Aminicenantes bacterium]